MNDKELLELAAKAAGIDCEIEEFGNGLCIGTNKYNEIVFDPLTDDGDTLRLAVKLCLRVECREDGHAYVWKGDSFLWNEFALHETVEHERCAATRRAIVRAAAAIGKEMR